MTDPRILALVHTDERIDIPDRAPIRPIDQPFIDFASPCQIWRGVTVRGGYPGNAGERSAHAKLTAADVVEIRRLFVEGVRQRVLAQRFGVSEDQISRIVRRVSWTHVE
ncbi:hypothetical protein WL47_00305 [Burkholderia ubonensis]|nr:hypothetical protein WL47_00305 [Burkholderia ubonensis]